MVMMRSSSIMRAPVMARVTAVLIWGTRLSGAG